MTTSPVTVSSGRIAWLDLVRAVSIVLVVLYHVGAGAGYALLPKDASAAGEWWSSVNLMLAPVRMPLFFMASGMLAVRAVHRPWRKVLRPRILDFFWPYLLWSAIFATTAWLRYAPDDPFGYMRDQAKATIAVMGPYWFIAVLPVFFVAARLGRSRPRLLLSGAAVVYIGSWPLRQLMLATEVIPVLVAEGTFRITVYGVWFIVGYVLRDRIVAFAEQTRPVLALLGAGLFVVATLMRDEGGFGVLIDRGLMAAATLSGLLVFVAVAPWLTRSAVITRGGRMLGSRTLAIYLIHPLVVNAAVVWYPGSVWGDALRGTVVADLFLVPVITALAIAIALGIHELVERSGAAWVFAAPRLREKNNTPYPPPVEPHDRGSGAVSSAP